MPRLAGKSVIITGGAGGIGAAAARIFAEEGARLLLVDMDKGGLDRVRQEIGDAAATIVADVTDPAATKAYVAKAVELYGGVDAVLLNAGIEGLVAPMDQTPLEMFDKVMAVNVRGVWLGLVESMKVMRERGGSIVITSSTAGLRGAKALAPYVASKHAVIGLMRSAALDGAAHNIRVNTVNPAPIETRMIAALEEGLSPGDRAKGRAALEAGVPLKRYGQPEEVARMMLFLASDESSFCNGGIYQVDGGTIAGRV